MDVVAGTPISDWAKGGLRYLKLKERVPAFLAPTEVKAFFVAVKGRGGKVRLVIPLTPFQREFVIVATTDGTLVLRLHSPGAFRASIAGVVYYASTDCTMRQRMMLTSIGVTVAFQSVERAISPSRSIGKMPNGSLDSLVAEGHRHSRVPPTHPPSSAAQAAIKGAERPTPGRGLTAAGAVPQSAVGRGQRPIPSERPMSRTKLRS